MPSIFDEVFAGLYGEPSWGVRKGIGSHVSFDFGDPCVEISPVVVFPSPLGVKCRRRLVTLRGDWQLWVRMCDWNIFYEGRAICHSESDDRTIGLACDLVEGQALTAVEGDATGRTVFRFDLGGLLETTPYPRSELEDTWTLFCPESRCFSLRSDGRYRLGRSDIPVDGEDYLELPE